MRLAEDRGCPFADAVSDYPPRPTSLLSCGQCPMICNESVTAKKIELKEGRRGCYTRQKESLAGPNAHEFIAIVGSVRVMLYASILIDLWDLIYRYLFLPIKLLIIYILTSIGIPF